MLTKLVGIIVFVHMLAWAQDRKTLAVLDFDGFGIAQYEAQTLTDRLRIIAADIGTHRIIERRAMEEVLAEQGFQQSGCASDECIVEVGQLLGVQYYKCSNERISAQVTYPC